jgi:hypothetical protein
MNKFINTNFFSKKIANIFSLSDNSYRQPACAKLQRAQSAMDPHINEDVRQDNFETNMV